MTRFKSLGQIARWQKVSWRFNQRSINYWKKQYENSHSAGWSERNIQRFGLSHPVVRSSKG